MLDNHTAVHVAIREATRPDHDRLDGLVSRLTLSQYNDLAIFLSMNRAGFAAIATADFVPRIVSRTDLQTFIAALDDDLATLGWPQPAALTIGDPIHPAAVDHIVLGSRLGTKVLRKRWQRSTDPRTLSAGAYFATPSMVAQWQDHLSRLGDETDVSSIVRDIRSLFGLFERGLILAQEVRHVA